MATIICQNCGAQLPDTKKFCTKCGTKIAVMTAEDQTAQFTKKFARPEESAAPAQEPASDKHLEEAVKAVFEDGESRKKEKRHNKMWEDSKNKNKSVADKKKPESKKTKKELKAEEKEEKNQQTIVDFSALAGAALDDSPYEPITAWGYIGILALFAVPVIGWLFAIVWACGGCRKYNKINLSRAFLLILGLMLVFVGCAVLAVWKIAPALLEATAPVSNTDAHYTVEGVSPSASPEATVAGAAEFDESADSLASYLKSQGQEIWNAYYDEGAEGYDQINAIINGDKDALLSMGYNETSIDQVLNYVNEQGGGEEALASLINKLEES